MNKRMRALMNLANAQKSTGPRTPEGKQRSRMNAFKHNLTGNNLILQEHEYQKYIELSEKLMEDLNPRTEFERQIAQKIIDTNFRLNRLAAIENNMLNFDMIHRETDAHPCDRTEVMLAQTRAWKDDARTFDILGRYESRLTRQLVLCRKELTELQRIPLPEPAHAMDTRLAAGSSASSAQANNSNNLTPEMASFGKSRFETLPPLPPPLHLKHAKQQAFNVHESTAASAEELRSKDLSKLNIPDATPTMETRLPAASSLQSAQADNSNNLTPKMASFGNTPTPSPATSCSVP